MSINTRTYKFTGIILISVLVAVTTTQTVPNHDIQASIEYHESLISPYDFNEPPVVWLLMNTPINTLLLWSILLVTSFILSIITMYLLVYELTKDEIITLITCLQYAVCTLTLILFTYGYIKQLLATAIFPLCILYFHRSLHNNKLSDKILTGLLFSMIGLTHEIIFIVTLTFFFVLIGYETAKNMKIPYWIIQRLIIPFIITLILCGNFYLNIELSSVLHAGGESTLSYSAFYKVNYSLLCVILPLALIGITQIKHHKGIILSLLLASIVLCTGWVAYHDRFILTLSIPLSILAGYGFKYVYRNLNMKLIVFLGLLISLTYVGLSYYTLTPVIDNNLNPLILPINIISGVFGSWYAVIMKFIIGIPLTVFLWCLTAKYLIAFIKTIKLIRVKR